MEETDEEFLKRYDPSIYNRSSVAVDCVVTKGKEILLVRRGGHPFKGKLALPGGFIEKDESAEQAVQRELAEETGLKVKKLRQLCFASTPHRDPRDRNISLVFSAEFAGGAPRGGDDASEAKFVLIELVGSELIVGNEKIKLDLALNECGDLDYDKTKIIEDPILAFDHAKIIAFALIRHKSEI